MKPFLEQYQMIIFVVLTFVLSWFPWYTGRGAEVLPIGPSIAAFLIVIALEGKAGLFELLRPFIRWRARFGLWGIALFGPAVLFVIGLGVYLLVGGQMPPFIMIKEELHLLPLYLFLVVLLPFNGPVGEEFGWRGYALPKLQNTYGPLVATLILGGIWGIWHLPTFFGDRSVQAALGLGFLIPYILGTMANSVYMTWLYHKSHASALIAGIIWHASIDFWGPILLSDGSLVAAQKGTSLPTVEPMLYGIVVAILVTGAAILTIATKGQLGCLPETQKRV